ncbi:MAG: beta-ketoacyl synthase [Blastopirellula sp.]|nr:MAG: beta-ketoacyl synthase [Blastopirellula sp.]
MSQHNHQAKAVIITGYGGISAAGRSSAGHGYRRIIFNAISQTKQQQTLQSLAQVMGLNDDNLSRTSDSKYLLDHSLIRQWDNIHWDANKTPFHSPFTDEQGQSCWKLDYKKNAVQSAAQMPKGFDPAQLYPSHHHPRGLQMAVYAASDAIRSTGIEWELLSSHVKPDEIAVYAGAAMGQLSPEGHAGMLQAPTLGKRTSSKQCALGLAQMPADFINAYVLGNIGATGTMVGACATFLYNLKLACDDIRSGKRRIVLVGTSEAPLEPEIVEGYNAMTALATEKKLRQLDQLEPHQSTPFENASRPFAENTGFTLAESAQFFVLCDAQLTLELGLTAHGSIGDVFVHADGYKKSISSPGIGNYITMGKALAAAKRDLGEEAVIKGSYVHAHGSSTPQNRTTESEIFSNLAQAFKIKQWPITAIKAHLGHSLASASADQLFTTLGAWSEGILPGITTSANIASDVSQDNLRFILQHEVFDPKAMPISFLNAKGFGGNNASTYIISPNKTCERLQKNSSEQQWQNYQQLNKSIRQHASIYDTQMSEGLIKPRYQFGENVLEPKDLDISDSEIRIKGCKWAVKL